jgi:hypothetical protein
MRAGASRNLLELLLILSVAFLENRMIDVPGIGPAAIGGVAGNVDKLAFLVARGANFGGRQYIQGIAAVVAFPDSHFSSPSFCRRSWV